MPVSDLVGSSEKSGRSWTGNMVAPVDQRRSRSWRNGNGQGSHCTSDHNAARAGISRFVAITAQRFPRLLLRERAFGMTRARSPGAVGQRIGRFQQADRGTIFLDERDLPPRLQPKLLRVLQEQEVEPLGGTRPVRVNVRVIAARSGSGSGCEGRRSAPICTTVEHFSDLPAAFARARGGHSCWWPISFGNSPNASANRSLRSDDVMGMPSKAIIGPATYVSCKLHRALVIMAEAAFCAQPRRTQSAAGRTVVRHSRRRGARAHSGDSSPDQRRSGRRRRRCRPGSACQGQH